MYTAEVIIDNELGIHARPASVIVKKASGFKSELYMIKDGVRANLKSIIGVLSLGVQSGDTVIFETDGEDAQEALSAMIQLANSKFGE
ncbi:MAG: HPr family phosphocarrier protein [Tissierellales bacterium]|nr:HPr family phosphocarrier protein [Tissierellales bacterium]